MQTINDPYTYVGQRLLPAKIDKIRSFWEHFSKNADALDQLFNGNTDNTSVDPVAIMKPLGDIAPELMWEFGAAENGHTLCITAEFRNEFRALARAVIDLAPDLPNWRFIDARTENEFASLKTNFEARFRAKLALSSLVASAGDDNKVVLTGSGAGSEEQVGNQILGVATYLLGEENDRNCFGEVRAESEKRSLLSRLKRQPQEQSNLAEFTASFEAAVNEICEKRPTERAAARAIDDLPATLMQLNVVPEFTGRSDMFLFNTSSETYANAALNDQLFASIGHSRFNEVFMFLKIVKSPAAPFENVSDRHDIEAALHACLSEPDLGGYVAAGYGHDAVYIDFAVSDLNRALPVLAEQFKDSPWYGDATLHFIDAGLQEHALGLKTLLASVQ